jgi:hypothetical protein
MKITDENEAAMVQICTKTCSVEELVSKVPEEINNATNWLSKKELNKLRRPQQELPDGVIDCLITLILFHCNISGENNIFAMLPSDV